MVACIEKALELRTEKCGCFSANSDNEYHVVAFCKPKVGCLIPSVEFIPAFVQKSYKGSRLVSECKQAIYDKTLFNMIMSNNTKNKQFYQQTREFFIFENGGKTLNSFLSLLTNKFHSFRNL